MSSFKGPASFFTPDMEDSYHGHYFDPADAELVFYANRMETLSCKHLDGHTSQVTEAVEVTDQDAVEAEQKADELCRKEEQEILKRYESYYPDTPKSLFHPEPFTTISRGYLHASSVVVHYKVLEELEEVLREHLRVIIQNIHTIAAARYTYQPGKTAATNRLVTDDVIEAALNIYQFPTKKDYISEEYAQACYEAIDQRCSYEDSSDEDDLSVESD